MTAACSVRRCVAEGIPCYPACPVSFRHGPDHSVDESSECCTPQSGCDTPRSVAPGRPGGCGIHSAPTLEAVFRYAPLAAAERFCGSTTYLGSSVDATPAANRPKRV